MQHRLLTERSRRQRGSSSLNAILVLVALLLILLFTLQIFALSYSQLAVDYGSYLASRSRMVEGDYQALAAEYLRAAVPAHAGRCSAEALGNGAVVVCDVPLELLPVTRSHMVLRGRDTYADAPAVRPVWSGDNR